MPFSNSPNIQFELLEVSKLRENFIVASRKIVVGMTRSLTREEWKSSLETKVKIDFKIQIDVRQFADQKFAKIGDIYYKIERTFVSGQHIELYLGSTHLLEREFYG